MREEAAADPTLLVGVERLQAWEAEHGAIPTGAMVLLLTGRTTRTLPVAAAGFITDTGVEWGRIMAMGTLIVIPPLLFTFFAARQIISGMTAGAVKG